MCKCRILEEANEDAYLLDEMQDEEMMIRDVVSATTRDFSRTIGKIRRMPNNTFLLQHIADLVQFIRSDDCFHFMSVDRDTYIELMLGSVGLNEATLYERLYRTGRPE